MSMNAAHGESADPQPVTVQELLLALVTYPLDAPLWTTENGGGGGELWVDTDPGDTGAEVNMAVWTGHAWERPKAYEPPVVRIVERGHPGDDFAVAQEFLDWLRSQSIGLVNPGHGHNETDSPVLEAQRARLAQAFAERGDAER